MSVLKLHLLHPQIKIISMSWVSVRIELAVSFFGKHKSAMQTLAVLRFALQWDKFGLHVRKY